MKFKLLFVAVIAFVAGYLFSKGAKERFNQGYDDMVEIGAVIPKQLGDEDQVQPPTQNEMSIPNFFDDRDNQTTSSPLGDNYPGGFCPKVFPSCRKESGCMLGCGPCSPLCSGEGNPCNITAPVPSAVWQPQSASTVQYRLRTGNYVPAYCKQGTFALQTAPACSNLGDIRDSTAPKQVTCYTAKVPGNYD